MILIIKWISYIVTGILLFYIAAKDQKSKKITNRSLMFFLIAALPMAFQLPITIWERLLGFLLTGSPLFFMNLFLPGSFGGGDIKLLAIAGGLLGWKSGLLALCAGFLAAGIYGVVMLAMGKRSKKDQIALGPFLCLGIAGCFLLVNK